MADKKITELGLIGSVDDDLSLPSDDGIQTYRVTAAQLKAYILGIVETRLDAIETPAWVTPARLADNSVGFPAFQGLPTFQSKPALNQSLTASVYTHMKLESVGIDTLGGTAALNSYSIGVDGFYLVIAHWTQSKTNASNASDAYLEKNGSDFAAQYHTTAASGTGHSIVALVPALIGDTIGTKIRPIGYTGTALESKTGFTIIRIA